MNECEANVVENENASKEIPEWMEIQKETWQAVVWQNNDTPSKRWRRLLVDWLMQLALETFEFGRVILHRTIGLLDLACGAGKLTITKNNYQLIGMACLWIIAKFEDIDHVSAAVLVNVADNTFSDDDLIRMEADVLVASGWKLCNAISCEWLEATLRDDRYSNIQIQTIARALIDAALLDPDLCATSVQPWHVADGCLEVADMIVSGESGRTVAVGYSQQLIEHMRECVKMVSKGEGVADGLRCVLHEVTEDFKRFLSSKKVKN